MLPALLLGLLFVYWNFPSRPPNSWDVVHKFRFDGEICDDLLEGREGIVYVVPEEVGTVTISEIAKRFNLEVAKVCAHTGQPPGCGGTSLQVGQELGLPLALDRATTTTTTPAALNP